MAALGISMLGTQLPSFIASISTPLNCPTPFAGSGGKEGGSVGRLVGSQ